MKKIVLLSFFLKAVLIFGQSSTHVIAGIDLNKNWNELTNLSPYTYISQERKKNEGSLGVYTTISEEYLKKNLEQEFSEINFSELWLVFPFGNSAIIEKLSPNYFIALKKYSPENEVLISDDFNKLVYIFMNQFGPPSLTEKEDWGWAFIWDFSNAILSLVSTEKDPLLLQYHIYNFN